MKARFPSIGALAFLLFGVSLLPLPAAIVLMEQLEDGDVPAQHEGLKQDLLSLPGADPDLQKGMSDFQRFGLGDMGFKARRDIKQLEFMLDQAGKVFDDGEVNQARILLEKANLQWPEHPGVELALADTLIRLKQYKLAREWVAKARAHGIKLVLADWHDALCLQGLEQFDEAIALYETVADSDHAVLAKRALAAAIRLRSRAELTYEQVDAALNEMMDLRGPHPLILAALTSRALQSTLR